MRRLRHRGIRFRKWAASAVSAAGSGLALLPNQAGAQTWTAPTDGLWSNALNWTSSPASSPSTILTFLPSASQTFVATDDMPGPFVLNGLMLSGTSTGSITVAAGSLSLLRFEGVSPSIQMNQPSPTWVTGRARLTTDTTLSMAGGSGTLAVAATLSGTGNLVISNGSANALILSAPNSYSGQTNLLSGRLELGHQDAIGLATLNASGGLLATTINSIPSGSPPHRPIFTNAIVSSGSGLNIGGNLGFTLSGAISGSSGVTFTPTNILDASWALSGVNSFSGPITVNGSSTPGVTSTLLFTTPAALGGTPTISINGAGAQVLLGAGSAPATFTQPVSLGALGGQIGAFSSSTIAQVTLSGNITGSGPLTSSGNGVLTLAGTNTFTGPLVLSSGITKVQSDANLGGAASTISLAGGALLLDPAFTSTTRAVNVATLGSTIYTTGSATFGGILSNSFSSGVSISGAGTLAMTGSNSFNNLLTINGGTVLVTGAAGRINNGGSIIINDGAALVIDNSTATPTRIVNNSTITLNGGDFQFIGNSTGQGTLDINAANLNIGNANNGGAGLAIVRVDPGAGGKWRVRFDRLNRTANNGTLVRFVGSQLGTTTIGTNATNATNVIFDNAPTLDDGLIPWAVLDTQDGNVDFATYDGSATTNFGLRRFTAYAADFTGGATSNPSVSSVGIFGAASTSISAMKLTGGAIDLTWNNAGTLTPAMLAVQSGGILVTGATTIGNASSGTLGSSTLQIGIDNTSTSNAPSAHIHADADLTINSRIVTFDAGGLVSGISKAGNAVLTLGAANTYVGPTRVLAGTLRLALPNALPADSEVFLAPGTTLDLTALTLPATATIGAINQTGALFNVVNQPTSTVAIGGATLAVGGGLVPNTSNTNYSTAINSNFTGTGTLVKNGNGTMTVVGPQAFTGAVILSNGNLVLGTSLSGGTAFTNASRIAIGNGSAAFDVMLAFDQGLRDGFSVPIIANVTNARTSTLKFLAGPLGTPGVVFNSNIISNGTTALTLDSVGGTTIAGTIGNGTIASGTNTLIVPASIITASSDGVLAGGPDGFAINITGSNTYTGTTTLTAISTLWGSSTSFGLAATAINLGSATGEDTPEVSSSVGGLTLSRSIVVAGSTDVVPTAAYIGSRAPAGSGTTTYSGTISIAGSRSRLVLFGDASPVVFSNTISGISNATLNLHANLQIGRSFGVGLETTRSNVTLSGANTFDGGTRLAVGTLGIAATTVTAGGNVISGPLGTGTFTIGTSDTPVGYSPTITAVGGPRTIANRMVVNSNFNVTGANALTFTGTADFGAAPRVINVDSASQLNLSGVITGAPGTALVKEGTGALALGSTNTYSGPTVAGEGVLTLNATQRLSGLLAVANGATLIVSGGTPKVVVTPALSIDTTNGGGHLDLTVNRMIVDYTGPVGTLVTDTRNHLRTGRLFTSSATTTTRIGYGDNAVLGKTNFAGEPVDSSSLLIKYTYSGDSDLDGDADGVDIGNWAINFTGELGGLGTRVWTEGDWDYDGDVDGVDAGLWAQAFTGELGGTGLGSVIVDAPIAPAAAAILRSLGITVVPEPASAAAILTLALVTRRRRRCR